MPGVCVALKWQQSSFKPSDPCRPWVWSVGRLCGAAVVKCLPSDCRTVIMMCWYVFPCLVEAFRLLCSCYFSVFMFLLCKCGGVTLLKKKHVTPPCFKSLQHRKSMLPGSFLLTFQAQEKASERHKNKLHNGWIFFECSLWGDHMSGSGCSFSFCLSCLSESVQ